MTAGELEVALAKIDINRHEAMDMLGSLGKSILPQCVGGIVQTSVDFVCFLFVVSSAESRMWLNIHFNNNNVCKYKYMNEGTMRNLFDFVTVKRDVQAGDEVGIRVKEQSIIELGKLFAKTRQAQGN